MNKRIVGNFHYVLFHLTFIKIIVLYHLMPSGKYIKITNLKKLWPSILWQTILRKKVLCAYYVNFRFQFSFCIHCGVLTIFLASNFIKVRKKIYSMKNNGDGKWKLYIRFLKIEKRIHSNY